MKVAVLQYCITVYQHKFWLIWIIIHFSKHNQKLSGGLQNMASAYRGREAASMIYKLYSPWFDWTGAWTHDLPITLKLHHRCSFSQLIFILSNTKYIARKERWSCRMNTDVLKSKRIIYMWINNLTLGRRPVYITSFAWSFGINYMFTSVSYLSSTWCFNINYISLFLY